MSLEQLVALMIFAFVSSITPGPNNLMLMTSGVNFGYRLTIGHMLGVSLGFGLMTILVGVGVTQLFEAFPISYLIMKVLCVCYMLFLAYKIVNSSHIGSTNHATSSPMTFIQAVIFQWVNPKAWTMALTAISVYSPDKIIASITLVVCIFSLINFPCISG